VALLEPVKKAFPAVSYADIYQMASARSIEMAGGPKIDMKYGRLDTTSPDDCPAEGNLPDAEPGDNGKFGGPGGTQSTEDKTAEGHLRKVFYRMGFDDEGIVALSGAHTFGKEYEKAGKYSVILAGVFLSFVPPFISNNRCSLLYFQRALL